MRPIEFPEHNSVYGSNQKEYIPLPAFKCEQTGQVVFCQSLSLKERLTVLFTGKIWVSLLMFGQPLTPSFFSTKKSDVLITKKNDDGASE